MQPSQIGWLVSLVAFVCTALVGQAELLGEPLRHWVTVTAIIASALSAFMLQHPWDGKVDRRAADRPTYIVIQDGVGQQVTHDGAAAILKAVSVDLPQPWVPR